MRLNIPFRIIPVAFSVEHGLSRFSSGLIGVDGNGTAPGVENGTAFDALSSARHVPSDGRLDRHALDVTHPRAGPDR